MKMKFGLILIAIAEAGWHSNRRDLRCAPPRFWTTREVTFRLRAPNAASVISIAIGRRGAA